MTETGAEKNITDMDTKQGQKHARQANNLIGVLPFMRKLLPN